MKDFDSKYVAESFRQIASILTGLADSLSPAKAESTDPAKKNKTSANKKEEKLTYEDLRAMLAEKAQQGLGPQVKEILKNHGVTRLPDLPESEYLAVKKEAETLHA